MAPVESTGKKVIPLRVRLLQGGLGALYANKDDMAFLDFGLPMF